MMNAQSDTNTVHEATLILLERTGVRVECEAALDLFAQHGVRVDHASQRVYPGVEQIEQALSGAPRAIRVYGRSPHDCLTIGGENAYTLSGGASLRVLTLDGRYEPATLEHLRQFNILLDALPNVHMCVNQVDPEEFRGPQLYRRLAAEMFIGCRKPICFQAASAADVTAMVEMGAAIRGSPAALAAQPMFMIGLNAEPPLSISRDTAEALIATCHADIPCSLGNYNMLGITAPITVAGAALQLNAVQLAAILLAQLVRPGVAMFYTAFSGSGNMRTLDVIAADPQAIQQQRLTAQLGRSYGLPVYGFAGTDARMPDAQAAAEHALQFYITMEAGCNLIQGPTSMMDQMMLSSFVQAVLDNEIWGYVCVARRSPPVSAETLAMEVIHKVVTDPESSGLKFVAHAHTARHLRDTPWRPSVFDYNSFASWQCAGRQTLEERAAALASDILANHQPQPLDSALAREIRRIAAVPYDGTGVER